MRRNIKKPNAYMLDRLCGISEKFSDSNLQRISLIGIEIKELHAAIAEIARKPDSELAFLRCAHFERNVPGLDGQGQLVKRQQPRPISRLVLHAGQSDIRRGKRLR